ncbi:MAG: type II secretion system F family protein [Actinomycetota bacterium]
MTVLLMVVLAAAAVLLGAFAVSTSIGARQSISRSLKAVEDYGNAANVREQEMLETIGERVLAPTTDVLVGIAKRFTPQGYLENLKRKIVLAGSPPGFEVDRFLIWKVLGVSSVALWFFLAFVVVDLETLNGIIIVGLLSFVAVVGPDAALNRRIQARRRELERALPDMLDLLVISVEAGLGFEQALDRTAGVVPGALAEEVRRMLQEVRIGASRADALRALDERTQVDDIRTFVLALLQADSFGISISRILRSQADEMRIRRHQRAQEQAQKAPVKMLFPLATCIFPSLFVVLLMPAAINIFDAL